jgi:hypothetical protein
MALKMTSLIESTAKVSREHLPMSTIILSLDLELKIYCIRKENSLC